MAIPTVNQLAVEMAQEVGDLNPNTTYVTTIEKWIQECIDQIGVSKRWNYLYSIATLNTIASTRTYNLTTAFEQELSVRYTDGSDVLGYILKENIANSGEKLDRIGKPIVWYTDAYDITNEKLTIGLFYVPDAVYTLEFIGKLVPQELASSSKLPFPRSFIHVLKDGVRAKIRDDDGNYVGANRAESKFRQGIASLQSLSLLSAKTSRLGYSDLSSQNDRELVRLPPDHFSN